LASEAVFRGLLVREGKPFHGNCIVDAYDMEGLVGDDLRDVAANPSRDPQYTTLSLNAQAKS
jgi:hypothetical protein